MEINIKSSDTKHTLHKELMAYESDTDDTSSGGDSVRDSNRQDRGGVRGGAGKRVRRGDAGAHSLRGDGAVERLNESSRGSRSDESDVSASVAGGGITVPGTGKRRTRCAAHLHESIREYPGTRQRHHAAGNKRDGSDTAGGGRLPGQSGERQHDNADRAEHREPANYPGDCGCADDRARRGAPDGDTSLRVDSFGVFPGGCGGRRKAARAFFQEEGTCR